VKEFLKEPQDVLEDEDSEEHEGDTNDGTCDNSKDQEVSINPESIGGLAGKNELVGRDHMNEEDTAVGRERGREETGYGGGSDMTGDGWARGHSLDEMAKSDGDVRPGWQGREGQTIAGSVSAGSVNGTEFGQNGTGQWKQAPTSTVQSANGSWAQASIF
jgi:hypothetical protein